MISVKALPVLFLGLFLTFPVSAKDAPATPEKDAQGRAIIRGPVNASGFLKNVHIISNTYGVVALSPLMITNSLIEAPVCVQFNGASGLTMSGNTLDCDLGVEFTSDVLMDHALYNNTVRGQMTNKPDVFGG